MAQTFRTRTRREIPPDRTMEAREFYMATRRPKSEEEFQANCQYYICGKCIATTRDPFVKAWRNRADYLFRQIGKEEARFERLGKKIDKNVRLIESKRHSTKKENMDAVAKAKKENKEFKEERKKITKELGDMSDKMRKLIKKADTFCSRCKLFSPGIMAERESLKAKDEAMKIKEEQDVRGEVQGEDSSVSLSEDEGNSAGVSDQVSGE